MIFSREVSATGAGNFMERFNILDALTCPCQKIYQDHDDDSTNGSEGKYGVKSHSV